MRLLVDSNIVAQAVLALRSAGHDVVYAAERPTDPGDAALLAEAFAEERVFLTKDHDIGALVHRDLLPHSGVLLIDDLGDPAAEANLVRFTIVAEDSRLAKGAFLRADAAGVREAS